MTQHCCNSEEGRERGVYIPLFVFLCVVMLALLGVAIDIGTVARTQMRLQKAADAGVLAGLAYRLEGGGAAPADVEERAQRFVEANLRTYGFPVGSPSLIVTPPRFSGLAPETLSTAVEYDVPLLLLPHVPFRMLGHIAMTDHYSVSATAKGTVPRANILLVLDTSSSMACPASDPDCSCGGPGGAGCDLSPNPGSAKIYELRRAVFHFLRSFREDWDRISLIAFDGVSQMLISFDRDGDGIADGFRRSDFETALGREGSPIPPAFQAGGLTNPSDGLLDAYRELATVQLRTVAHSRIPMFGNEPASVVFFTDGSPTAATYCLTSSSASLPRTAGDVSCPAANGKRYTQFEFEWVGASGARTRSSSPLYSREGLQGLAKTDRVPQRFAAHSLLQPACGRVSPNVSESVEPCLSDLSEALPDGAPSQRGERLDNYKRSFYHRTLTVAAFLQRHRVTLYGIGLGPLATPAIAPNEDLYQNADDDFHRKDGFLLLLANDLDQARSELKRPDGAYPAMSYSDMWTVEARLQDRAAGRNSSGEYLRGFLGANAESQHQLSAMFETIAHRILVRLTV